MIRIINLKLLSQTININTNNMPERRRINQTMQQLIMIYLKNPERNIKNKWYIDTVKAPFNTRLM